MNITQAKRDFLWWQKKGLSQTASGYGRKLTSSIIVKTDIDNRWRRVYVTCFSNTGSFFVMVKGKSVYFSVDNGIQLDSVLK